MVGRQKAIAGCLVLMAASALSGCSSDSLSQVSLSNSLNLLKPTVASSGAMPAEDASLGRTGPVAPEDLVDAAGQCAGAPSAAPDGSGAAQGTVIGGIALGMSECDVVRRAGQPSNVVINADNNNLRLAVLTYGSGNWPGIYRFSEGRLKEIDRGPTPEPQKPTRAKKPPRTKPRA